MLLGIDVGGTHTDAVLIDRTGIVARAKVATDHADLLASICRALQQVHDAAAASAVTRVNLSTTLSTNAIIEGTTERVAMLLACGPGIPPHAPSAACQIHLIDGYIDHRGSIVAPLDLGQAAAAVEAAQRDGFRAYGVVTKFSTRNPAHENQLADITKPAGDFTARGHQMSGRLNFARRITTTYLNAAVWHIYQQFADAVQQTVAACNITAPVYVLKADGGTLPLALARQLPVATILSGPAASIMGVMAQGPLTGDTISVDIGGTTTDIGLFAAGLPIVERDGICLQERPTHVRAFHTRSVGIGGDSAITVRQGTVCVGPRRLGPCMADGGTRPALIDAYNVAREAGYGATDRSAAGIADLARQHGMPVRDLAHQAIDAAVRTIGATIDEMVAMVNNQPVYTIAEMLHTAPVTPTAIYCVGGPARMVGPDLQTRLGMPVTVPADHKLANAIGAALARPTMDVELLADTERGTLIMPALGICRTIDARYDLAAARRDAAAALDAQLRAYGISAADDHIDELYATSFNMITANHAIARNIRVCCQLRPGLIAGYAAALGAS